LIERGVRLALESERPIAHVADDLGIHRETLRKCVRQAEADSGKRGDIITTQEREEIRKLRRENFELRRANEILKCTLLFFSFVIDVYGRKVVGWQFASRMRTTLVLDALRMALCTRERVQEVRLVPHSDGAQYVSGEYTQTLTDHDVPASVGSTGDAYDNCMAESSSTASKRS
jgi:transposase